MALNSFGESSSDTGDLPPPRQTNEIDSEITIPNGCAVIVGGLTRADLSDTASMVPWLGELPFLGQLFGLHSRADAQSTLFVFIRPMILRDDQFADLKYLSDRDLRAAEMPPNFPTSQPLLME